MSFPASDVTLPRWVTRDLMARFRSLFGRTFSQRRSFVLKETKRNVRVALTFVLKETKRNVRVALTFVLKETKRNVRVALTFVLKEIKRNVRVALAFVLKERLSDEPQIIWLWSVAYNVYVNVQV